MSRAKNKMGISEEESVTAAGARLEWVNRFLASLEQGDIEQVLSLLTEDVEFIADGGGKVPALRRPLQTRDLVPRFLLGGFQIIGSHFQGKLTLEKANLNNETGLILRLDGEIAGTVFVQLRNEKLCKNVCRHKLR